MRHEGNLWNFKSGCSHFVQSCDKDVKLISTICETDKKLVIYDARPYGNAFVNKVGGGGFEKSSHYPKIKVDVLFCNMDNIHCVRTARSNLYTNVINAKESNGTYFQNITYSKWYDYIACMLKSSIDISSSLKKDLLCGNIPSSKPIINT